MLKTLTGEERFERRCTLALGGFDGLHLGHRALVDRARRFGKPAGITTVLGVKGDALFSGREREFLFERAGLSFAIEWEFTETFRNLSAAEFLQELFSRVNAEEIVCGEDFRFGKGAAGTPALLRSLSPCPVYVQKSVTCFSEESGRECKVSTSLCKRYLTEGKLSLLNACLVSGDFYGSAYFIGGEVEHGRQEGRKYGFPTLNLSVPSGKLLPPDGVYGGLAATPKGNYPMILNIGARPTFHVGERKIEAYLDGFSGDLYGAEVRLYPMEFYRPIVQFPSPEALREQLERDVGRLRMNKKEENV